MDNQARLVSRLLPAITADDPPWVATMRAIKPPPMTIVHEGWFRDQARDATVEEVRALTKR